uniref:Uncharacterized protein n=1 Tax=Ananas comosus var. bracteatus TaxID=296719 RepID=A0A6V7QLM4_ANACO|nr:unnamed protein product [Ananas comosus var. bracteatus]
MQYRYSASQSSNPRALFSVRDAVPVPLLWYQYQNPKTYSLKVLVLKGTKEGVSSSASVLLPPSVAAFLLPSWQRRSLSLSPLYEGGATLRAHFLGNSNETSKDLTDKEYPFDFMLASAWFVITMLADCVVTIMVACGMGVERFRKGQRRRSW